MLPFPDTGKQSFRWRQGDDRNYAKPEYSVSQIARNRVRNCDDRISDVAEHSLRA
jgi:hypothetical protein